MDLQKRRADLRAHNEQLVGQINCNNGAISLLDELIAEAPQQTQETSIGGIDRSASPFWKGASGDPDWVQGSLKEMPHATLEDEVQS